MKPTNLNDTLASAIMIAAQAHVNQKDLHGEAYILHPLRVMSAIRQAGYGLVYQIAGVLHDVIEDSPMTDFQLACLVGDDITSAVVSVSKRFDETGKTVETYAEFVARAGLHPIGRVVKFFDLQDNLNPARMHPKAPVKKYQDALQYLADIDRGLRSFRLRV